MTSPDRAHRAVTAFVNLLLAGPLGQRVRKVVLFGSVAKGTAHDDSDVDVLVVLSRPDGELVAEAAFEIQTRERVGLEPVTVTVEELYPVRSFFLHTALRTGKEVYTVSADELKREERANLIALAEEYLEGAEQALAAEHWRIVVDAAYNAMELAMKSMILEQDDDLPGSHGGIVGRFGELYVRSGRAERSLGRRLNQALERRNHARYRFRATIGADEARHAASLARELIDLARADFSAAG